MKKSVAHLPLYKRNELRRIVDVIRKKAPETEIIVLFGSHATIWACLSGISAHILSSRRVPVRQSVRLHRTRVAQQADRA
jgi:hypothetical protein